MSSWCNVIRFSSIPKKPKLYSTDWSWIPPAASMASCRDSCAATILRSCFWKRDMNDQPKPWTVFTRIAGCSSIS
ncbi:hypothetical protein D3C71_1723780 [compost metagenome]